MQDQENTCIKIMLYKRKIALTNPICSFALALVARPDKWVHKWAFMGTLPHCHMTRWPWWPH